MTVTIFLPSSLLSPCLTIILSLADVHTGTECCGSLIDFGNNTSPTGTFTRITTGPAFYVSKGEYSSFLLPPAESYESFIQATVWPGTSPLPPGSLTSPCWLQSSPPSQLLCPGRHPGATTTLGKVMQIFPPWSVPCTSIHYTLVGKIVVAISVQIDKSSTLYIVSVPTSLYGSRPKCGKALNIIVSVGNRFPRDPFYVCLRLVPRFHGCFLPLCVCKT